MKKIFSSLSIILLVVSCENDKKETVVELGANKEIENIQSCHCDSLTKNKDGLLILNNRPYTGTCELYYPNSTEKYMVQQLLDGQVNGSIFFYDKNGSIILEEEYVKGKKIGNKNELLMVNCKDLVTKKNDENQKIYYYKDKPFSGTCEDYYPETSQTYMVSNYKDGKLNGYTTYFNKDGSTLIMNKYENNQVVSEFTTTMSEIEK
jgi:antitoxin component YwqK of YwqJK toxin-antitoxin module